MAPTDTDAPADAPEAELTPAEKREQDIAATRDAELKAGTENVSQADKDLIELAKEAPAGARVGQTVDTPTVMGKVDQMSRRSGADALEGHFVTIDPTVDGVEDAYRDARLIRDEDDPRGEYRHTGFYGVYIQPAATDPVTGIPVTAVVRLRDDTNALVRVPYEALSPAQAGGR